ncbi:MAG: Glycosyl transferase, group 1, partial [Candidatus Daviesbacteria bacterium GW2011_GWB1_36_5]
VERKMLFLWPIYKKVFSSAAKTTAISEFLRSWAQRMGSKNSVIIPNGVDVSRFDIQLSEEERIKIRESFNLKKEDIILVTTSRLVTKNGVGDVIKSLPSLAENIKFLICGEGELEKSLKLEARSLKLENRVIFAGNVSHENLPKYLKACDVFIRPSLSEGMGNSFIEAFASRIPVIATPVGGIVDFLVDPAKLDRKEMRSGMEIQTGYFCEPNNPESISKTVVRVLEDTNKEKILENAYKLAKEKYDWNLIAEKFKEVFKKV